jgi:hypothetical protein
MAGINSGKVVAGGLVAGVVFAVLDVVNSTLLMAADYEAGMRRLGLDPETLESPSGIGSWVVVNLLFGLLVVWLYAAIRPRFGPGPKTALRAGFAVWLAATLLVFGLTTMGIFTLSTFVKTSLAQAVIVALGSLAGARFYQEG